MKKFTGLLVITACIFSVNMFAESSKLTKVDLDVKTTQIVKADLGRDDLYYYIDTNACVCWLSRLIGGSSAVAVVDCAKLAAHPKLEQYVSKCTGMTKQIEIKKEEPVAEVKKEEVVVDSKKDKKDKKDKDKKDKKEVDKKDIKDVKQESDKVLEEVMENKTPVDVK